MRKMMVGRFLVGVYTDNKTITIEKEFPMRVENVCKECALQSQIDVSLIQLFSLFHIHRKIWLNPNHELTLSDCGTNVEYMFRIRFHPETPIREEKFLHYLRLQYRHSFTKEFEVGKIKNSILFGLGIFDMITDSYERGLTLRSNVFQSKRCKTFFPVQQLKNYSKIQLWLLKCNLKNRLQQKHEEYNGNYETRSMENTYINKIRNEFYSQITKETYKYKDRAENEKIVTVGEKDSEFMVCFENKSYYLKSVRAVNIKNNFVEIFFSGFPPKMIKMEPDISKSFVSAMDGFYRLAYNYHYGICNEVLSPRILMLQRFECYDHIEREVAIDILLKAVQKNCYLLRMSKDETLTQTYDVFALDSENSKISMFTVGLDESVQSLQETHPFLQHKLKPKHFEWCNLLFCYKSVGPTESSNILLDENNRLFMASEISFSDEKPFSQGIFTETYKAKIKDSSMPHVSIKTLKGFPGSHQCTQIFMEGVYDMLEMCENSFFLKGKGIIMKPKFGFITEFPNQSVASYLSSNNQLPLKYILEMAFTVAESLEFLRKQNIVHGDISCENLKMTSARIVKLTDASIVNKIYLLPKSNLIYKSRLPWLDPQVQFTQSAPTFESDIFSYGTMLCEMLCLLCKPPKQSFCQANYEAPCRLHFKTIENEDMAQNASSVRKQLHEIILQCRLEKREDRPQPLDISKKLVELIHEPSIQKILLMDSPRNSLCDHTWNMPPILQNDVFVAIKFIQENSRRLKVQKSEPDYEIDEKNLKRGKKLGSGAYGVVYFATYSTPMGKRPVALKTMSDGGNMFQSELEILHKVKHERIVEFIGFCRGLGIVMEYVEGGDLLSKLQRSETLLYNLKNILLEITEGMEYLQSMKIIHRDLAARNILLTKDNHVKITDFGLSSVMVKDYYKINSRKDLPLNWCSPEQCSKISSKSDVWSFGVVMWECYSLGKKPKLVMKNSFSVYREALESGKRLNKPEKCPGVMYKIMQDCWTFKAEKRPDFTSLKKRFLDDA